jgi:hypothetical protein
LSRPYRYLFEITWRRRNSLSKKAMQARGGAEATKHGCWGLKLMPEVRIGNVPTLKRVWVRSARFDAPRWHGRQVSRLKAAPVASDSSGTRGRWLDKNGVLRY